MPPPAMIATGNDKRAEPETVAKGLARAMRCVCAISGAGPKAGTGTLIGPDLVLTNYHVVERLAGDNADFEGAECRFDYRIGEDGRLLEAGNAQTIFNIREVLVASRPSPGDLRDGGDAFDDDKLDFAIVRLDVPAGRLPDSEGNIRGWIPLPRSGERPDPDIGQEFMILQYPFEEGGAFILQPLKEDTAEFVAARGASDRAAAARFVHRIEAEAEAAGFAHALNTPYSGGHILDRHGDPARGIHAIQIEWSRALYLDAALDRPGPGLPRTARTLRAMIDALADEACAARGLPLAAE